MRNTILLFLFAVLLASCAVSSKVTPTETYQDQNFSTQSMETKGLAILPVVAGQGVEGYRRPFGDALNQVGDSILTSSLLPWQGVLDTLNSAGLVKDYNEAIQAYNQTGIIDKSILTKMKEATSTNYFLFVRLAPPVSDSDMSYDGYYGVYETETKSISASGLVWGADEGDVVWEGTAEAVVKTDSYSYTKETTTERAKKVARALMETLVN